MTIAKTDSLARAADISPTNGAPPPKVAMETAAAAAAEQARAEVEARFIIAMRRPRDMEIVRQRLLKECARPNFAESARYKKPMFGGKDEDGSAKQETIDGPSIRFAEAAMRALGNVMSVTATVFDDDSRRIVRQSVVDLESNISYSRDVVVAKVVERKFLRKDQVALSERTNAYGKTTYTVAASEDALLNKEGALVSKAMRTNALRHVPTDLIEECMDAVIATIKKEATRDPGAAKTKMLTAFAGIDVTEQGLSEYLGHDLSTLTPEEVVELRQIYETVRDGEATWADVLAQRTGEEPAAQTAPPSPEQPEAKPAPKPKREPKKDAAPAPKEIPPSPPAGAASPSPALPPESVTATLFPADDKTIDAKAEALFRDLAACETIQQILKLIGKGEALPDPYKSTFRAAVTTKREEIAKATKT